VAWRQLEVDEEVVKHLYNALRIHPTIAHILVSKGIKTPQAAEAFLYPKLAHLQDPFAITHMYEAIELLEKAVHEQWAVSIIGDYDVDGITSTTLLVRLLRYFGLQPQYFIPRRFTEGYGMSSEIVDRMLQHSSPRLVIALDCGTNAVTQIQKLRTLGIQVLIIDHHQSNNDLPKDCVLINPHVFDTEQNPPWRYLCTAGLMFKFIHAFLKHFRKKEDPRAFNFHLRQELDLVAMGTIADLVSLAGENRILTYFGLRNFSQTRRTGIDALCRITQRPAEQPLLPEDISFRLGPRINASGRLADAIVPVQMLLSEDRQEASILAQSLDEMNTERQKIERLIIAEAEEKFKTMEHLPGIFFFNPAWHSGIVGIVCGKFARDYQRPCVVLGEERGWAKGSGRSVAGYDLVNILTPCAHLLESWGGHPMAVGISLKLENVPLFQKTFQEAVLTCQQSLDENSRELLISKTISLNEIDKHFLTDLEKLQPYGQDNSEPIFALNQITLTEEIETFGKDKKHIRLFITDGINSSFSCIYWNGIRHIPPIHCPLDLAIKVSWEYWQCRRSIRIELIDWKHSSP
jgi:single-stranded-DNA-specific exonuclease